MEAQVTIKASVEDLDLLRRALTAHRSFESEIVKDTSARSTDDMKRKQIARQEIVMCTDMLLKLGVRS
jgi:hypothetical protein